MNRRAITLIEIAVVLAIFGVLAAILAPVFIRPAKFHSQKLPPQNFQNARLESVVQSLFLQLQSARVQNGQNRLKRLEQVRWENENLKARRVWFATSQPLSLREILRGVEKAGQVEIRFTPGCGNGNGYHGPATVRSQTPSRQS